MSNADLLRRSLAAVWHPGTQMKQHEHDLPLVPAVRGEGLWLYDADGRRYLDGISSGGSTSSATATRASTPHWRTSSANSST